MTTFNFSLHLEQQQGGGGGGGGQDTIKVKRSSVRHLIYPAESEKEAPELSCTSCYRRCPLPVWASSFIRSFWQQRLN